MTQLYYKIHDGLKVFQNDFYLFILKGFVYLRKRERMKRGGWKEAEGEGETESLLSRALP